MRTPPILTGPSAWVRGHVLVAALAAGTIVLGIPAVALGGTVAATHCDGGGICVDPGSGPASTPVSVRFSGSALSAHPNQVTVIFEARLGSTLREFEAQGLAEFSFDPGQFSYRTVVPSSLDGLCLDEEARRDTSVYIALGGVRVANLKPGSFTVTCPPGKPRITLTVNKRVVDADGQDRATVTVSATNAGHTPMSGLRVPLTTTLGTLKPPLVTTNAAGLATSALTSPNSGPAIVSPALGSTASVTVGFVPVATAVAPGQGPEAGGTATAVTGSGFFNGSGVPDVIGVFFGANPGAGVRVVANNVLNVTTPPGAGVVPVTVHGSQGPSRGKPPVNFTYQKRPGETTTPTPPGQATKPTPTPSASGFANYYIYARISADSHYSTTAELRVVADGEISAIKIQLGLDVGCGFTVLLKAAYIACTLPLQTRANAERVREVMLNTTGAVRFQRVDIYEHPCTWNSSSTDITCTQ